MVKAFFAIIFLLPLMAKAIISANSVLQYLMVKYNSFGGLSTLKNFMSGFFFFDASVGNYLLPEPILALLAFAVVFKLLLSLFNLVGR